MKTNMTNIMWQMKKKKHTYHLVEDLKFDRKKEKCNFTQLSHLSPPYHNLNSPSHCSQNT